MNIREALKTAREMGHEAAINDTWMQPCPEEHLPHNIYISINIGDVSQSHIDAWCETTHWQLMYGDKLSELADQVQMRLYGEITLSLYRYEDLYIPLRDAFWDAWEDTTNFYPKVEEAIKQYRKDHQ